MESRNPAFRKNTFAYSQEDTGVMTMSGAINKAGILFVLLIIGAAIGWNLEDVALGTIAGLIGFGLSFVVIFKRTTAPIVSPIYAVLDGIFVGTLSVMVDNAHPGIAANAMALTFGVLGLMLVCYRMGLLRATPVFTRVVVMATMAVLVVYVVDIVAGLFGASFPLIHQTGYAGIIFSLIITGIASLNLILDFDLFEKQTAAGAPKYMEWYCGFSLLVTIVWIYVEMLRLLSKLSRR